MQIEIINTNSKYPHIKNPGSVKKFSSASWPGGFVLHSTTSIAHSEVKLNKTYKVIFYLYAFKIQHYFDNNTYDITYIIYKYTISELDILYTIYSGPYSVTSYSAF